MSIPVLDHMQNTSHTPYVATTGTANTYAVSLSGVTAYTEGMALAVKINVSNTTASTININALGAKTIKDAKGADMKAGTLTANSICTLRYNGTNFILQGDGSDLSVGLTATAGDILSGKTAAVNGAVVTGTIQNQGVVAKMPGRTNHTLSKMYFAEGSYLVGEPNLLAENIKKDVSMFGVLGTLASGAQTATGYITPDNTNILSISGLAFQPKIVYFFITPPDADIGYGALKITSAVLDSIHGVSIITCASYPGVSSKPQAVIRKLKASTITPSGFSMTAWEETTFGPYPSQWVAFG